MIFQSVPINTAISILVEGGFIIYPTETFYGIGCMADKPVAISEIYRIKNRPYKNPLPLLAGCIEQVDMVCDLSFMPEKLFNFWPGPLTIILPVKNSFDPLLINEQHKAAIRVTSNPVAASLANGCAFPLTSSSANLSGSKPTGKLDKIDHNFMRLCADSQLPFAISADCEKVENFHDLPSTIVEPVKKAGKNVLRILRKGAISISTLINADFNLDLSKL